MFESQEITDEIRSALPGSSVKLSGGSVYYELQGPEDGELVVLIHGMSIPFFVWDPTWDLLLENGFRVLRYDLYGRGYSDRPKTQYNLDLYIRQLSELLHALGLQEQKSNLIGFSFGTAIAAAFALHAPDLVKSICLIGPVHPDDMPDPPGKIWKSLLKFKFLAANLDHSVIQGLPNNFYNYDDFPDFEEQFSEQLEYKGFAAALTSTLTDFDYAALPDIYRQVGQLEIPICIIWGEEDFQADIETSAEFRELIPVLQFHAIEEAGHLAHYERPDLVNPILLNFLTE